MDAQVRELHTGTTPLNYVRQSSLKIKANTPRKAFVYKNISKLVPHSTPFVHKALHNIRNIHFNVAGIAILVNKAVFDE